MSGPLNHHRSSALLKVKSLFWCINLRRIRHSTVVACGYLPLNRSKNRPVQCFCNWAEKSRLLRQSVSHYLFHSKDKSRKKKLFQKRVFAAMPYKNVWLPKEPFSENFLKEPFFFLNKCSKNIMVMFPLCYENTMLTKMSRFLNVFLDQ